MAAISLAEIDFSENLEFSFDSDFDIEQARNQIFDHGCIVIRRLIPKESIALYNALADHTYEATGRIFRFLEQAHSESGGLGRLLRLQERKKSLSASEKVRWSVLISKLSDDVAEFERFKNDIHYAQISNDDFVQLNSGASLSDILELSPHTQAFVKRLLGTIWYPGSTIIRRVGIAGGGSAAAQEPIYMHCDGPILSRHAFALNFWVPLNDCGVDAPGIQFVPGPFENLRERVHHDLNAGTVDVAKQLAMQDEYTNAQDGRPRYVPRLERGDVAVFHNWVIHGGYHSPDMEKIRTSMELRFNAPKPEDFYKFASGSSA